MIARIRPTTHADLPEVMNIYAFAQGFMHRSGNPTQWPPGYPSAEHVAKDIDAAHSFVCENENGEIVATFCFILGDDPTYARIYEGAWLNRAPYGTVHRLASAGKEKGVAEACFRWCFAHCPNIRVDTHRDNRVMQHLFQKLGFTYCGIIYVANGTPRMAYQRTTENNKSGNTASLLQ